jgi:hypothetical protein
LIWSLLELLSQQYKCVPLAYDQPNKPKIVNKKEEVKRSGRGGAQGGEGCGCGTVWGGGGWGGSRWNFPIAFVGSRAEADNRKKKHSAQRREGQKA